MLRYLTAGESHGKALMAIIDGFPAGFHLDLSKVDQDLRLRQGGYGRGGRQKLETDSVEIMSGTWQGTTIGSPIGLQIVNRDYKLERLKELDRPRPGHADLAGAVKFLGSVRGVLERASARETAARVAVGSIARQFLEEFGIQCVGYVRSLGKLTADFPTADIDSIRRNRNDSIVYMPSSELDDEAKTLVDKTADDFDTLGGILEVQVRGLPIGLGTHTQWDRKLDTRLSAALMSIQAIKGVEIGMGFECAQRPGSEVHDPIAYQEGQGDQPALGFTRSSNNAGGIEGGMTNGQPIVIRAAKKPIATLRKGLESIHLESKKPQAANYERSDVCAVPAASIITEAVVSFEIANALIEKLGGDSIQELKENWDSWIRLSGRR